MRAIVAFLFILPTLALCETAKIEVGDPLAGTVAALEKIGAVDITGGMAIMGPKGEWPLKGIYWEVPGYDAVLELSGKKEKVGTICFWTKKDFCESKSRREDARCRIKSATFDTEKKTVSVEKAPGK